MFQYKIKMEIFDVARKEILTKSRNTSSSFKKQTETIENQKELQMKVSASYLKNIFYQKTQPSKETFPQIKSNPNIHRGSKNKDYSDYPQITKPEITENPSEKDKSTLFSIQTKNQSEHESIVNCPQDKDLIDQLNNKLKQSARAIKQLTVTNRNQKRALEKLSSELDTYINHASKQMIKNNSVIVKETPVDIVIKVKEKELKNAMTLIDILTKDNNNLQLLLNKTGLQEHHKNLIDQIKDKDRTIQTLLNQNKLFKKELEDYRIEMKEKKEQEKVISRIQKELLSSIEDGNNNGNCLKNKGKDMDISPDCNNRIRIYSPSHNAHFDTNKKRNKKIRLVMPSDKNKQETQSFISEITKTNQTSSMPKKSKEKLITTIERDNLVNKAQELNEKNDYLNRLNQESDLTIKHLQFQVNEYKTEANIYKKKYKESLEREAALKKMITEGDSPSSLYRNNKLLKADTTANNIESIPSS